MNSQIEQTDMTAVLPGSFFPGHTTNSTEPPAAEAGAAFPDPPLEPKADAATVAVGGEAERAPAAEPAQDPALPIHPACELFPMMQGPELQKLAEDIKVNGLVNPIVMHDGQVIDGRNRLVACRMGNVEPKFIEWREMYVGPMSLYDWIWSVNAARRHLTTDQVAIIQVTLLELKLREEARRRQIEAGRQQGEHGKEGGRGNAKPLPMKSSEGVSESSAVPGGEPSTPVQPHRDRSGETRARLAEKGDVSEYKIQQAMKVVHTDPKLAAEVAQGKMPLRQAAKKVKSKRDAAGATTPRRKRARSKGNPRKSSFDVAGAVNEIMRRVDAALDKAADEDRKAFLKALKEVLKTRR
jgi:hypothetical protein